MPPNQRRDSVLSWQSVKSISVSIPSILGLRRRSSSVYPRKLSMFAEIEVVQQIRDIVLNLLQNLGPSKVDQRDVQKLKDDDWTIRRYVSLNDIRQFDDRSADQVSNQIMRTMRWRSDNQINNLKFHLFPQFMVKSDILQVFNDSSTCTIVCRPKLATDVEEYRHSWESYVNLVLETIDNDVFGKFTCKSLNYLVID